jgi:BirA family biotin operon repressor/biotin-[acetyl-CoA-carboxylase] ligase
MIIGSNIFFYDHLPSTNSEAARLLKESSLNEGAVICAGYQSAGRGQKDNKWESEENKNLLISIILFPEIIGPEKQFLISETISLGICDFILRHTPVCSIKWPNDIYVNNDKIAGVLIENSIMSDTIEYSIAGIGLNINQESFLSDAPNPVSLRKVTGVTYDILTCRNQLISDLDLRYKQLLSEDWSKIRSDYISKLYRLGTWNEFTDQDGQFSGRIESVDDEGTINIRRRNGLIKNYGFKEVAFIP